MRSLTNSTKKKIFSKIIFFSNNTAAIYLFRKILARVSFILYFKKNYIKNEIFHHGSRILKQILDIHLCNSEKNTDDESNDTLKFSSIFTNCNSLKIILICEETKMF